MGNTPDPSMLVVPAGITEIVLGVVDDRAVPIGYIEGAVGTDLAINRSEVGVFGSQQRGQDVGTVTGSVLDQLIANDRAALEAAGEELTAKVIRPINAYNHFFTSALNS